MTFSIRPITDIKDCRVIEQLQIAIWGFPDLEVTPADILLIIAKDGGNVLLAEDEAGQPVGFAFGLLGLTPANRLKLSSHMAGVLPAYQNSGLGYQLKAAQRESAMTRGLDLITWTFDPLQSRNAYLNLGKLGAVCCTYLRHLYGDMPDALNRGLPSDRFQVDWWLASTHVTRRLASPHPAPSAPETAPPPLLNPVRVLSNGFIAPPDAFAPPDSPFCRVEIPPDLSVLKTGDPDLALAWRLHTREVFETCFAGGYTVVDLQREAGRIFYRLQKDWQPE